MDHPSEHDIPNAAGQAAGHDAGKAGGHAAGRDDDKAGGKFAGEAVERWRRALAENRLPDALALSYGFLRANPLHAQGWLSLAETYAAMGRSRSARAAAMRGALLDPEGVWREPLLRRIADLPDDGEVDRMLAAALQVPRRPAVAAVVIACNDERRIARCLASAAGAVDEIVVLDLQSTDRTREVAARFPNVSVHRTDWRDSFAEARNEALALVRADWALMLDANEWLHAGDRGTVRVLAGLFDPLAQPVLLQVHRAKRGGAAYAEYAPRLFAVRHGFRFRGRAGEEPAVADGSLWGSLRRNVRLRILCDEPGADDENALFGIRRRVELLRRTAAEEPDEPLWRLRLGRELFALQRWDEAENELLAGAALSESRPDFPLQPELQLYLARIAWVRGDWRGTASRCRLALERAPDFPDAHYLLARALTLGAKKSFRRAEELAVQAAERAASYRDVPPPDPAIRAWRAPALLADLAVHRGRLADARAVYRACVDKAGAGEDMLQRKLAFIEHQRRKLALIEDRRSKPALTEQQRGNPEVRKAAEEKVEAEDEEPSPTSAGKPDTISATTKSVTAAPDMTSATPRGLSLLAGCAKRNITPPHPVPLAGFAHRTGTFTGVAQPLYLRVMVLRQEDASGRTREAVIAAADLLFWGEAQAERLRGIIGERFGIDPAAVLLHSSHTHSGPQTSDEFVPLLGRPDPAYLQLLERELLDAVREARADMTPVTVERGVGECGIGVYRRKFADGAVRMLPNPDVPIDRAVRVVRFLDGDLRTKAVFFHHACHPTTTDRNEVSSEFPGAAAEEIEDRLGEGAAAFFLQGCCGDIRPALVRDGAFYRGDAEDVRRLGRQLAEEVLRVLAQEMGAAVPAVLEVRTAEVRLPFQSIPEEGDLAELVHGEGVTAEWAATLLARGIRPNAKLTLQYLRIAEDVALLAMNGEIVSGYGDFIIDAFGGSVLPLGYSNGMIGYVPTAAQIAEGGYEADDSHRFFALPGKFSPEIERLIEDAAASLVAGT